MGSLNKKSVIQNEMIEIKKDMVSQKNLINEYSIYSNTQVKMTEENIEKSLLKL